MAGGGGGAAATSVVACTVHEASAIATAAAEMAWSEARTNRVILVSSCRVQARAAIPWIGQAPSLRRAGVHRTAGRRLVSA
jgi:hypothetical protein